MAQLLFVLLVIVIGWIVISSALGVVFSLIIPALFAILAGYLAGKIIRGKGYGPLGDLLLGFGGGIVGSIVFNLIGVGAGGLIGGIVAGVVGAVILVYAVRLFGHEDFAK